MQPAHLHLIRHAIKEGCEIEVTRPGTQPDTERTNHYETIKEASEAADLCWLNLFKDNKAIGQAMIAHDDPYEDTTVADYTGTPFFESWWQDYEALQVI